MQLVYGGYQHDVNSVSITSWNRSYVLSESQWPKFLKVTAAFKARLVGQDLFRRAYAMQTAYMTNGLNMTMYDNSSNLVPIWSIDSSTTVGGTIVTSPVSFSDVQGAQGATYLICTFAIEALFPLESNGQILSFQETVTFDNIDGGPIQVERIPATGTPILQNVTERSFYFATQEGSLTQGLPNPLPMQPLWPSLLRRQPGASKWTLTSPKTVRGVPHEYGVKWSYQFVSTTPIIGAPNVH